MLRSRLRSGRVGSASGARVRSRFAVVMRGDLPSSLGRPLGEGSGSAQRWGGLARAGSRASRSLPEESGSRLCGHFFMCDNLVATALAREVVRFMSYRLSATSRRAGKDQ